MGVLVSQPLKSVEIPCPLVLLSLAPLIHSRPRDCGDVCEGQRAEHRWGQFHHLRLQPHWTSVPPHSVSGLGDLLLGGRRRSLLLGTPLEENYSVLEADRTLSCLFTNSFIQVTNAYHPSA